MLPIQARGTNKNSLLNLLHSSFCLIVYKLVTIAEEGDCLRIFTDVIFGWSPRGVERLRLRGIDRLSGGLRVRHVRGQLWPRLALLGPPSRDRHQCNQDHLGLYEEAQEGWSRKLTKL